MILCHGLLLWLSPRFGWGTTAALEPTLLLVALLIAMGALWMTLLGRAAHLPLRWLPPALLAGLVMRLLLLPSTPIYEDDWYRYLWDGASVAHGINPWRHPPADALTVDAFGQPRAATDDAQLTRLRALAANQPYWPQRVAYPYLTSPYPPLTQAAFGVAHLLAPFSLTAWRALLLLADLLAVAVLLALLRRLQRPPGQVLLYWWNPLVPLVSINMGHMDVLLAAPLLTAVWLRLNGRPMASAAALGAATLIKLWPALLLPLMLCRAQRAHVAAGLFALLAAGAAAPLLFARHDTNGLGAYATWWNTNGWLFGWLQAAVSAGLAELVEQPGLIARMLAGGAIAAVAIWQALRLEDEVELVRRCLWVVLALFLLAPAGYPWYALWFLPLLALEPVRGAALFAVSLPLYFLRFPLGDAGLFERLIVPAQFAPPLALLLWDASRAPRMRRG